MNAPELAKYINERLIGPQKDSDKEITEQSILIALRQNCPLCGGEGSIEETIVDNYVKTQVCHYCKISSPENVDDKISVPNNDTKE